MSWLIQTASMFCLLWIFLQITDAFIECRAKHRWIITACFGLMYQVYCFKMNTSSASGLIGLMLAVVIHQRMNQIESRRERSRSTSLTTSRLDGTEQIDRAHTTDLTGTACQTCYYASKDYYLFPCALHPGQARTICKDWETTIDPKKETS
ncbi:hypothetical protein ACQ4M3_20410 [Leptolyngbya sp. AN03gr2]|uniref:hypothetical protein n=1 Tax=unclassified Leptolyngbya TaxID=2650499 RepID=UPI003D3210A2